MNIDEFSNKIIDYCKDYNLRKVYICGNGGAGKTTLSKKLYEIGSKYGKSNIISLDDFMADTEMRKNTTNTWYEDGIEHSYRYTSSNKETYFLRHVYEVLYNLDNGNDYYYFPRRYETKNNIRKLYKDYFLTVIEGIGTAFLDRNQDESISIFITCSKEDEQVRRAERLETHKERDKIELYDENRSSQFRVNVLPTASEFDIIVRSVSNYQIEVIKNRMRSSVNLT